MLWLTMAGFSDSSASSNAPRARALVGNTGIEFTGGSPVLVRGHGSLPSMRGVPGLDQCSRCAQPPGLRHEFARRVDVDLFEANQHDLRAVVMGRGKKPCRFGRDQ